jgi:hypothetical protein
MISKRTVARVHGVNFTEKCNKIRHFRTGEHSLFFDIFAQKKSKRKKFGTA